MDTNLLKFIIFELGQIAAQGGFVFRDRISTLVDPFLNFKNVAVQQQAPIPQECAEASVCVPECTTSSSWEMPRRSS